jgi:hypothetical protein
MCAVGKSKCARQALCKSAENETNSRGLFNGRARLAPSARCFGAAEAALEKQAALSLATSAASPTWSALFDGAMEVGWPLIHLTVKAKELSG